MLVAAARNGRGTKRETANWQRIVVLTRSSGSAENGGNLPLRPDGGVVTQRTANPSPRAENRQSLHNSPSVPLIAFQGLSGRSANCSTNGGCMTRKSRSKPVRAETVKLGSVHESGGPVRDLPKPMRPKESSMTDLETFVHRSIGLHEKLANCHPSLRRGQVWCRQCGYTESVSSAYAFKHGWPKHCGYTMTIDAPETCPGE